MKEPRPDQVVLPNPPELTLKMQAERNAAIAKHNKMQTRYALTKNPVTRAALAERLKQSWIALGGPMPEKEVGDA